MDNKVAIEPKKQHDILGAEKYLDGNHSHNCILSFPRDILPEQNHSRNLLAKILSRESNSVSKYHLSAWFKLSPIQSPLEPIDNNLRTIIPI